MMFAAPESGPRRVSGLPQQPLRLRVDEVAAKVRHVFAGAKGACGLDYCHSRLVVWSETLCTWCWTDHDQRWTKAYPERPVHTIFSRVGGGPYGCPEAGFVCDVHHP